MKLVLSLLTLSFLSLPALAANVDLEKLYEDGSALQQSLEEKGEMDYLLNPIFCLDTKSNQIALIFSYDFRHKNDAYLISNGRATKVETATLNLTSEARPGVGHLDALNVKYKNKTFVCVSNGIQLELPNFGR
jgi:hypothetical protein